MINHKISYYWYCQLGGWGMFILVYIFFYFTQRTSPEDYPYYFHVTFFEAGAGLLVTHFMRYVIRESKLLTLTLQTQILWLVVLTLSFALVYNTLVVAIEQSRRWEPSYYANATFAQKWFSILMGSLMIFTVWSLSYYTYHYVTSTQRQRINQIRLETLVKELELKTIKAHINPHFIFNALNGIRALVDENPGRARTAITQLSQLLRSSMNADTDELVPLGKELDIVKNYLALEGIRFENRLAVQFEIDDDTLYQKVPPMMLQTLVENAIKHGISKSINGGWITIASHFKADHYELTIRNTGHLSQAGNPEGFGLSSTRNRLLLLFGNNASFNICSLPNQVVEACVKMPVNI
jgi:two-component system, LytTR family, sensor kinase